MALKKEIFDLEMVFTQDVLGGVPKSQDIYGDFIAQRLREHIKRAETKGVHVVASPPDGQPIVVEEMIAAELATVQTVEEKGWTGFRVDKDGYPILLDYMLKGFFKESARTLKEHGKTKQLKDKVTRYLFIMPREIKLILPADFNWKPGQPLPVNERPLRCETAQGPRVALARSDYLPARTKIKFQIHLLDRSGLSLEAIQDIAEYGQYIGIGQWRSGGYGRLTCKCEIVETK